MDVQIKAEFEKSGFSLHQEEEILQKCKIFLSFLLSPTSCCPDFAKTCLFVTDVFHREGLTYCINFTLTPSDLVSYWEVYYLNR